MRVLVIGANSAIARACARRWAARGNDLLLVARNAERLARTAADLDPRGTGSVLQYPLDLDRIDDHEGVLRSCFEAGPVDLVLVAHGSMADQALARDDSRLALADLHTNAVATIALLTNLAPRLERQGHGRLAVISSVAGDRGRPSNYPYAAGKAAVDAFCEGLRGRLFQSGVGLTLIRPGRVATPMTEGLAAPLGLQTTPEVVARDIVRALDRGRDTLYTPRYWAPIMWLIRHLPTVLFKRLDF